MYTQILWDSPSQLLISKPLNGPVSGCPWQVLHSDDARSKALKKAKPQAEAAANPCSAWDRISLDLHIPSLLFKNPVPNDFIPTFTMGAAHPGAAGPVAAAALGSLPAQPCTWASDECWERVGIATKLEEILMENLN